MFWLNLFCPRLAPCFIESLRDPVFEARYYVSHSRWLVSVCKGVGAGKGGEANACIHFGDMHYHFAPVSGSRQLHIGRILITI